MSNQMNELKDLKFKLFELVLCGYLVRFVGTPCPFEGQLLAQSLLQGQRPPDIHSTGWAKNPELSIGRGVIPSRIG